MDLDKLSNIDLLKLQSKILDELGSRGVVRTRNNPIGDYAEWLVSSKLNLQLQRNSKAGYDAVSKNGIRYQIKSRRVTAKKKPTQLSAIRKINEDDFDVLIALIFNAEYEVITALEIPKEIVIEYSRYKAHVNANFLHIKGPILNDNRVISIIEKFK